MEGPTEYLLVPKFYEKITGRTCEEDEVTIISCRGIKYKNYLRIAEGTEKKVAVITDNDNKQKYIDHMNSLNNKNNLIKIFMDNNLKNYTWEVSLYNENKDVLNDFIEIDNNSDYKVKGKDPETRQLGKMLNNKTKIAYSILVKNLDLNVPGYVEEAIEWITK